MANIDTTIIDTFKGILDGMFSYLFADIYSLWFTILLTFFALMFFVVLIVAIGILIKKSGSAR